jgi:hypothetical protein
MLSVQIQPPPTISLQAVYVVCPSDAVGLRAGVLQGSGTVHHSSAANPMNREELLLHATVTAIGERRLDSNTLET